MSWLIGRIADENVKFFRVNTADPVHFTLTPPECHMEIRDGYGLNGNRISGPVRVGDPLTLAINMRSNFGQSVEYLQINICAHAAG